MSCLLVLVARKKCAAEVLEHEVARTSNHKISGAIRMCSAPTAQTSCLLLLLKQTKGNSVKSKWPLEIFS